MARELRLRSWPVGQRSLALLALLAAGVVAAALLPLSPRQLWPEEGGRALVLRFFSEALQPRFAHESSALPASAPSLIANALGAARRTLTFAVAAMSLALLAGLLLGCLSSTAWWMDRGRATDAGPGPAGRRAVRWSVLVVCRVLIVALRSVHELLWAVLFLAALGLTPFSGVMALAIPFAGVLAKVFSEMLEEAPRRGAEALHQAGASALQVLAFGLLPAAAADMAAYTFYRFECAVRAAAVLGFFGYETLGLFIRTAFENNHFNEVWSYLYLLLALVLLVELWSGAVRKRFVA